MRICSFLICLLPFQRQILGTDTIKQYPFILTCCSLTTIMNSLLGHSTVTVKTCAGCGLQTLRKTLHEQDRILHLGWDQERCLEQILREREFNDHVYHDLECSRCRKKRQHPYSKRLWTAPDVLIIHFVRFQPNKNGTAYRKNKVRISRVH